jgi:serine/threonine protein kinase
MHKKGGIMGIIDKKGKARILEELVLQNNNFRVFESYIADKDRVIAGVGYKSSSINAVLKVPLSKDPERQCKMAYELKKEIKDGTHLVRLIGLDPFSFGEYYGILMEPAEIDLGEMITEGNYPKLSEKECLDVIIQVALGLQEIHHLGHMHRDIKPSNMLRYKNGIWVLSDFGTATEKESTVSSKNTPQYWSPELRQNQIEGHGFRYSFEEDIFQLGISFYMALTWQTEEGFFTEFTNSASNKHLGKEAFYAFINKKINEIKVNDTTRYFLRRMMGEIAPEHIPSGKTPKDFRYKNIDSFLSEARGKAETETVKPNPDYERFTQLHKQYLDAIASAAASRNGKWGTVSYQAIDRLMRLHEQFSDYANKDSVKLMPSRNEIFSTARQRYDELRQDESRIIDKVVSKYDTECANMDLDTLERDFFLPIYEMMFLWGPPFTNRKRDNASEKAICTLAETQSKSTWYHNSKIWRKKSSN